MQSEQIRALTLKELEESKELKQVNVLICQYNHQINQNLIETFNYASTKFKVKINCTSLNNELEIFIKVQKKRNYSLILLGEKLKFLPIDTIIPCLKQMIKNNATNSFEIMTISQNLSEDKDKESKVRSIILPISKSEIEEIVKELI